MRRAMILLVLWLCLSAQPTRAYVPEKTPHRGAASTARRLLEQPETKGSLPGIVIARGGKTLFALNAERAFIPASLMKLATTTAAMVKFGPSHRFVTRVLAPSRGARVSSLYLVGGGDPTLATEAYRRARFLPKQTDEIRRPAFAGGSPTIEQLAAGVARAGIRTVAGDVFVDESRFDAVRTPEGWLARYLRPEVDSGLLTAMPVNEGRGDLKGRTLGPPPPLAAGRALVAALAARNVAVTGSVRAGTAPRAVVVARVQSPPLAEMIDFINRYSINFHAEVLLKSLGAEFGRAGSTAEGVRVVRGVLRGLDVPLGGFVMTDASGLSLLDRMTPRTVVFLLRQILTRKGEVWGALRASLPVAGEPGTLQRRMRETPARGNLRGKTGQIRRVRAMAGWVTGRDAVPLVYVVIFNQAARPLSLTRPLDLFGLLLAGYPIRP